MPHSITPLTAEQVKEAIIAAERATAGREVFFEVSIDWDTVMDCIRAGIVKTTDEGLILFGYKIELLLKVPGLAITVYHNDPSWIGEDRYLGDVTASE